MNTTNLITDYIISGILGILCIFLPFLLLDNKLIYVCLTVEAKNATAIAIFITVCAYSFGVLFNQISDYLENVFFKLISNKIVEESEEKLKENIKVDHHYALQFIVAKSQSAYDYVSFRRTMIRIIRALLSLLILLPILHIMYSFFFFLQNKDLTFCWFNFFICLLSLLCTYLINRTLKKLYKGYYAAITNFYKVLAT